MVNRKIIWDTVAKNSLKHIIAHIKEDSDQNAEIVKNEIFALIKEIPKNPERYNIDKYKKNNDNNFRALEIYHVRIAYFIESNAIRIIRIRSTYQEPLEY